MNERGISLETYSVSDNNAVWCGEVGEHTAALAILQPNGQLRRWLGFSTFRLTHNAPLWYKRRTL